MQDTFFVNMQGTLHLDDDPPGYLLKDLEHGQHSRLITADLTSNSASSGRSSPMEASLSIVAWFAEKMVGARLSAWIQGPQPSRAYIIVPLGGSIQVICLKKLKVWLPQRRHRELAVVTFLAVWLLAFVVVIHSGNSTDGDRARLSCISRLWYASSCSHDQLCADYIGLIPKPAD
jgi:hypothetical protein